MEEASALKEAVESMKKGQPMGDGIGPMVVGQMMLDTSKQEIAFETVWSKTEFEGRELLLVKAKGPNSTVGRPGEAIENIIPQEKPDLIIMIDAALKLEGEDSASIAKGFGAAMGGIGTDRFQIEDAATKNNVPILAIVIKQSIHDALTIMTKEIATKNNIPILAIVVKQTIREAVTLMSENIAKQAKTVRDEIYDMINENTKSGETVMIVGVGNTLGILQ